MSLLHRHEHGAAAPEAVTSNLASEATQRTREGYDSTGPNTHTRRRFLRTLLGAGGLVAAGGGVLAVVDVLARPESTADNEGATAVRSAAAPNFLDDLTLNQLRMPETINPATFAQVFANVGQAVQFEVNHGLAYQLPNLIPGGRFGLLQPEQFQYRADWIAAYRTSSEGTMMDRPDNPLDPRYYAWGFSIEMLEQLDAIGVHSQDPHALNVSARVRVTIGDLPPVTTMTERPRMDSIEPHNQFETNMLLTRVKGMAGSNYVYVNDVNGHEGYGWAIASADNMQQLPSIMREHLPKEFQSVPELFAQ